MRNLKYCCIALFLAICVFSVRASASPLSANGNLTLTPFAETVQSYQLAKVYFLPDWSDKGMSFDGTDEKPCTEACPQKTSYDCASGQTETYTNSCGLTCSRCVECYGCEAKGYTLSDCPENASCLNDCCNNLYKLESCDSGYVLDGNSCRTETCSDNPNICTGGKTCVSGKCETSTCKNGGITCSGSAGVCNTTTGQCVQCMTNSDCGGGKECNTTTNTCILPADPCENITCTNGTCSNGTCQCNNGFQPLNDTTCVECTQDSHCENGVCQNNQCVAPRSCQVGDIYYTDRTCSDTYITDKEPLGVIVDPKRRLLIGLNETNAPFHHEDINFAGIAEEIPVDATERGYDNTSHIYKKYTGQFVSICWRNNSNLENGKWYIPGTGELNWVVRDKNALNAVNNGLQKLGAKATPLKNKLWTSDEFYNNNGVMIAWNPGEKAIVQANKTTSDIHFRCVGRYKCPTGTTCEDIVPYSVIDSIPTNRPSPGYIKGQASCSPNYQRETFVWNSAYSRCYLDTAGSGTTDPSKPACQVDDYVLRSSGGRFCSPNDESATLLGRVFELETDGDIRVVYPRLTNKAYSRNNATCNNSDNGLPTGDFWSIISSSDISKVSKYVGISSSQQFWGQAGAGAPEVCTLAGSCSAPYYDTSLKVLCVTTMSNIYRK